MNNRSLKTGYDFTNKSVIITGGTGVLGAEIACALVGCGANVLIIDKNTTLSDEIVERLKTLKGHYQVMGNDILDRDQLQQSAEKIVGEFGSIDCLINAAGGNHPASDRRNEI